MHLGTADGDEVALIAGKPNRDLIVVGASAGGVEALRELVGGLPVDLPATVLVVLHLPVGGTSALAAILDRSGPLPARTAASGDPLRHGEIVVAPPDRHLLVSDAHAVLSRGPTESGRRPAVDALFRSAARALGPRVTGVLLSGVLDDGAAGMVSIASRGGLLVVQDPSDALHAGMPSAALNLVSADHVLAASAMGPVLAACAAELVDPVPVGPLSDLEPECDGGLTELTGTDRFRWPVGQAGTADTLLERHGGDVERALWTAYRMTRERASLARRLASGARERRNAAMARHYAGNAREAAEAAEVLRQLLLARLPPGRAVAVVAPEPRNTS